MNRRNIVRRIEESFTNTRRTGDHVVMLKDHNCLVTADDRGITASMPTMFREADIKRLGIEVTLKLFNLNSAFQDCCISLDGNAFTIRMHIGNPRIDAFLRAFTDMKRLCNKANRIVRDYRMAQAVSFCE